LRGNATGKLAVNKISGEYMSILDKIGRWLKGKVSVKVARLDAEIEPLEVPQKYFPSLNQQVDTRNGGYGDTGVDNAGVGAAYIHDVRSKFYDSQYTHIAPGLTGRSYVTPQVYNFTLNRIQDMLVEQNKILYDDPVFYGLFVTGILARKICDISAFILGCADMYYGYSLTADLTARYYDVGLLGQVALDDLEFRGMSMFMSAKTFEHAVEWMNEKLGILKQEYGKLFGMFKPLELAYRFVHRVSQMAIQFEGQAIGRSKRKRIMATGMPNASIRSIQGIVGGVFVDVYDFRNGEVNLEMLFDELMSDLVDFQQTYNPLLAIINVAPLVIDVDPVMLGTGMWTNIHLFETSRDENLYHEIARPRLIRSAAGVTYEIELMGNGEVGSDHWVVWWYSKDKPTWFTIMPYIFPVRNSVIAISFFEPDGFNDADRPLGAIDVTGIGHANVYMITYDQIAGLANPPPAPGTAALTPHVVARFEWAPIADLEYWDPLFYRLFYSATWAGLVAIVNVDGNIVTPGNPPTIAAGAAVGALPTVLHESIPTLYVGNQWDDTGESLRRAIVPLSVNTVVQRGSLLFIKDWIFGRMGNYRKNFPTCTYGSGNAKRTSLKKGKPHKDGSGDPEHVKDGKFLDDSEKEKPKEDSTWIPDDQWAKMTPEEKKAAKAK
jgi:hypothetical protein